MSLKKGTGQKSTSDNVRTDVHSGKPPKQIVPRALNQAPRSGARISKPRGR